MVGFKTIQSHAPVLFLTSILSHKTLDKVEMSIHNYLLQCTFDYVVYIERATLKGLRAESIWSMEMQTRVRYEKKTSCHFL